MKVTNATWFTQMGVTQPIGIVFGEDEATGEKKAYIGAGYGNEEDQDCQHIARTGAKLSLEMAKHIVEGLTPN